MIGENGFPETPDWHPEPREIPGITILPADQFDRLMSDLDEPPRISAPLRRLVLQKRQCRDIPANIILGAE